MERSGLIRQFCYGWDGNDQVGCDMAGLLRCDKVLRGQVGSGEVRTGSHGGVRSGIVVNGDVRQVCYGAAGNGRVAFGFIRFGLAVKVNKLRRISERLSVHKRLVSMGT